MQVRLAFSVAIQAKSDILVLDEILAVGDEAFQRKSREFFEEIRQDKSKTVILVTHDMSAVQRYCNKVIYIKDGKLEKSENLQEITNQYSEDNLEIDHIDGNSLNNRKSNLRFVTHQENVDNIKPQE